MLVVSTGSGPSATSARDLERPISEPIANGANQHRLQDTRIRRVKPKFLNGLGTRGPRLKKILCF